MGAVRGCLGQVAPSATTLADAYTVPSGKYATVKIVVCNRAGAADTYRVAVSPGGASIADSHYRAYDMEIAANDSVVSAPIMVGALDVIRVYSTNGSMSFGVTGVEKESD